MVKGQWVRIISMEGEPRMTGRIGQYDHTDDMGQVHGSWGCAIHADTDSYELITEEQAKTELARQAEVNRPKVSGFGSAKVPFLVGDVWCAAEVNFATTSRVVCGVKDCDCRAIYSEVEHACGISGVAVEVNFRPCDLRKSYFNCVEPLRKAVRLAMKA